MATTFASPVVDELAARRPRPLKRLLDMIERYVVMSDEQRLVVALWIVHAHCVEHFEQTPYLAVTSPEKQCGKSRLLELLELLVPRPWPAVTPTEAVVYRTIELAQPTLLLDEVDTIFNEKTATRYEGLRALLNAGHRRGARVPRCVGPSLDVQNFSVYCAKVLAGIGVLPDTVADRSIPIRLQRKTASERVERFRRRDVQVEAQPVRDAMAAWAAENGEAVALDRPEMPDELSDRMQEGCEPLVAIADRLGYGEEAREALVSLLTIERQDSVETAQLRLLRDLRAVFEKRGNPAALWTTTIIVDLCADESEWATWYGSGLSPSGLAKLLKPYGIESTSIREGANVAKGYKLDALREVWRRYLPADDVTAVTAV
jgi:hypothetical protein